MKKSHIALIVIACVVAAYAVFSYFIPMSMFFGSIFMDGFSGNEAKIEIDGYRLCKDANGDDVVIIRYLLKNDGEEPTCLIWEGDFYVYQNGVGLTECYEELPKECDYDTEDQFKNIKGGVEYCAEIAYLLNDPDADVEVEVDDYGLRDGKKQKVFQISK